MRVVAFKNIYWPMHQYSLKIIFLAKQYFPTSFFEINVGLDYLAWLNWFLKWLDQNIFSLDDGTIQKNNIVSVLPLALSICKSDLLTYLIVPSIHFRDSKLQDRMQCVIISVKKIDKLMIYVQCWIQIFISGWDYWCSRGMEMSFFDHWKHKISVLPVSAYHSLGGNLTPRHLVDLRLLSLPAKTLTS